MRVLLSVCVRVLCAAVCCVGDVRWYVMVCALECVCRAVCVCIWVPLLVFVDAHSTLPQKLFIYVIDFDEIFSIFHLKTVLNKLLKS